MSYKKKSFGFPKPKHSKKSTLKKKNDILFSKIIRSIGECQAEGKDGIHCGGSSQTMHIITRSNLRLRWDIMNAICGCGGHHIWYTNNPNAFFEFIKVHFPEKWAYVNKHKKELNKETYEEVFNRLTKMDFVDIKEV